VRSRILAVRAAIGDRLTGAHFHDTRGLGLANVLAALDVGIRSFDASLGGLGGCPFAPGASGNIATEDLVFMLESMGLDTGIDIDRLIEAQQCLASLLPEETLHGKISGAGLPRNFARRAAA
jgi:hydroxymethylglutaryl-CoA lyase